MIEQRVIDFRAQLEDQTDDLMSQLTEEQHAKQQAVGQRVTEARLGRHMSQQKLAEKAGVSLRTVQHWEAGTTAISLRKLPSLAKVLDVSEDWIMFGREDRFTEALAAAGGDVTLQDAVDMASGELAEMARRVEQGLKLIETNNRLLREIVKLLKHDPLEQRLSAELGDQEIAELRSPRRRQAKRGNPRNAA